MKWKSDDFGLYGPVTLGMSREETQKILNGDGKEMKRFGGLIVTTYDHANLHVVFDDNETVSMLRIFAPNEVTIGSTPVLGFPFEEIKSTLTAAGIAEEEDVGLWCKSLNTFLVEVEDVIDAVEVFRDCTRKEK
jgi:hypothetical protein